MPLSLTNFSTGEATELTVVDILTGNQPAAILLVSSDGRRRDPIGLVAEAGEVRSFGWDGDFYEIDPSTRQIFRCDWPYRHTDKAENRYCAPAGITIANLRAEFRAAGYTICEWERTD